MTNFKDFVAEQKINPELKKEYDAFEPEFSIVQASLTQQLKLEFVPSNR